MLGICCYSSTRILKTRFLSRVRAGYRQLDSESDKGKQSANIQMLEIIS
jgi:hypothetical protein